ncbi:MAG: ABC transporter substrate-binding protein, partial [Planctomycetota bacterium]
MAARAAGWLLLTGLLGCGGERNVLCVANGADVQVLDPQIATGAPEGRVLGALFCGLTRLDPHTLKPLPALAGSWEVWEGGRRWSFLLRAGLRWSDGTPLSGRDVVESWLRLLDPRHGGTPEDRA